MSFVSTTSWPFATFWPTSQVIVNSVCVPDCNVEMPACPGSKIPLCGLTLKRSDDCGVKYALKFE